MNRFALTQSEVEEVIAGKRARAAEQIAAARKKAKKVERDGQTFTLLRLPDAERTWLQRNPIVPRRHDREMLEAVL